MTDYIHLIGTEDITSAARSMSSTADHMRDTHNWSSDQLTNHRAFLDDWLTRFNQALLDHDERARALAYGHHGTGPR